jgi:hypothetical protein
MPSLSRTCRIAACVAGLLLAACGDSPDGDAQRNANATKPKRTPAGELPAEMVSAVSAGRNSTVISVHFALGSTPVVNQPLPVEIAVVPHEVFTLVRAHFEGHQELALATGNVLEPKSDPAPEKPIKHQLVLLPVKEGLFMVTAIVETEGADGTVTRVFSIPVIVAPPASAAPAVPATAAPAKADGG